MQKVRKSLENGIRNSHRNTETDEALRQEVLQAEFSTGNLRLLSTTKVHIPH